MPRKHGWLEHPRCARDARERFGEGCNPRPQAGRGRRWGTWTSGLEACAAHSTCSRRGSFFPSFSFASFLSPLPLFLIPAQPLSCLPDPRPSPPLAVTSKSKDKTHPRAPLPANPWAAASVTVGAQALTQPPPASSPRVWTAPAAAAPFMRPATEALPGRP